MKSQKHIYDARYVMTDVVYTRAIDEWNVLHYSLRMSDYQSTKKTKSFLRTTTTTIATLTTIATTTHKCWPGHSLQGNLKRKQPNNKCMANNRLRSKQRFSANAYQLKALRVVVTWNESHLWVVYSWKLSKNLIQRSYVLRLLLQWNEITLNALLLRK